MSFDISRAISNISNIDIFFDRDAIAAFVRRLSEGKRHPRTFLYRHREEAEVQLQTVCSFGARMGWVVSVTPQSLYPMKRPSAYCVGGCLFYIIRKF